MANALTGWWAAGCLRDLDSGLQSVELLGTQLIDRTPPDHRFGDAPGRKWNQRDNNKRPIIRKSDEFLSGGFLMPLLHESLRLHPYGGLGGASRHECCPCQSNDSDMEII